MYLVGSVEWSVRSCGLEINTEHPVWLWKNPENNLMKKIKQQMYNFSSYKENVQIRFLPLLCHIKNPCLALGNNRYQSDKKLKYQMYNFSFYKENVQIRFPPFLQHIENPCWAMKNLRSDRKKIAGEHYHVLQKIMCKFGCFLSCGL